MRAPQRRLDAGLIADSQQSPERYEFFQLVRLYELALRGEGGEAGERLAKVRRDGGIGAQEPEQPEKVLHRSAFGGFPRPARLT